MTNQETLTSEERAKIIELILRKRAEDNPTAGSGYFAAARAGLEADPDSTLINRAKKLGHNVTNTKRVNAPTFKESPFTLGETRTFEDGRTGTVVDIAPLFTIFEMNDGNILAYAH